jgi:hypothetical protein
VSFWKGLLAKSIYRKISYLSRDDTARLVCEPLAGSLSYPPEVVERIYRLLEEDLDSIVTGIVDNPLPQMICSWNSLPDSSKVLLAALGRGRR